MIIDRFQGQRSLQALSTPRDLGVAYLLFSQSVNPILSYESLEVSRRGCDVRRRATALTLLIPVMDDAKVDVLSDEANSKWLR